MRIVLPPPPFSPWLRLAHIASWGAGTAVGQGTRRRLHDWKLLLQLSGTSWLWYEAAGGRWPLRPGDLALVPPGQVYAWGVPLGTHLAVHFDLHAQPALHAPDMVEHLGGPVEAPWLASCPEFTLDCAGHRRRYRAVVAAPSPRAWRARLQPLVQQGTRRDLATPAARLAAGAVLQAAVAEWFDLAAPAQAAGDAARQAVATVLDRLGDGPPPRDLDIPTLARRAGLGETAFRTAFHRLTGTTPRAWLEQRRIEHAARLLRDGGCSVAIAAAQAGYADPFHFTRVFRRVLGKAPLAWRSDT